MYVCMYVCMYVYTFTPNASCYPLEETQIVLSLWLYIAFFGDLPGFPRSQINPCFALTLACALASAHT